MGSALQKSLMAIARELLPEPDRVAEAKRRALTLIKDLHNLERAWMFEVEDAIPHGSHARDTAIVGFKDIDYLVVLNPDSLRTANGEMRTAADTVQRLARILRQRRGGLVAQGTIEVRAQEHSVGVKYPTVGLRVDLVPALRTNERGCFLIPDRTAGEWIETRPHRLKGRITRAEGVNAQVRTAIRLVKGWRRARGKAMQIPSYAVELLMGEWASKAGSLEGLVRLFFETFADAHANKRLVLLGGGSNRSSVTVCDPWSGVNVTEELDRDHRARLVENARRALDSMDAADEMLADGRERAARTELRRVFKGAYE